VGSLLISALSIGLIQKTPARDLLVSVGDKIYPPSHNIRLGIPQEDLYCHLPQKIQNAFQDCLTPPEENAERKNIFLIGDSHASNHHWSISNALEQAKLGVGINTLVEYGLIRHLTGEEGCGGQSICIKNAGTAYADFFSNHLKEGDYLLVSLSRDRFTIGEFDGSPRKQNYQALQSLQNNLLALSRIAQKKKATLVLIGDIPKVCSSDINYIHEVVRFGNMQKCTVDIATSIEDRVGLNNVFEEVANTASSTLFVDPHNELCSKNQCSAVSTNGIVLYGDASPHFSKDSKDILTTYWLKTIIALGSGNDPRNNTR